MYVTAEYSHKGGKEFINRHHPSELEDIYRVIGDIDAEKHKVKTSREKTMPGRMLYSPPGLNEAYTMRLAKLGWAKHQVRMEIEIPELGKTHRGFREIDFLKNELGLEVQFGKYAFMVYNILAKMSIFGNQDLIDSGVEVVAMRHLTREMSTGVSYFEQIKSDLVYRGAGDIDVPVLVIGVDAVQRTKQGTLVDPSG